MSKKPALGRGLGALLQSADTDITSKSGLQLPDGNQQVVGAVATSSVVSVSSSLFCSSPIMGR